MMNEEFYKNDEVEEDDFDWYDESSELRRLNEERKAEEEEYGVTPADGNYSLDDLPF